jgi:hypothetical protein
MPLIETNQMKEGKINKVKYMPETYENGDTHKQLLAHYNFLREAL